MLETKGFEDVQKVFKRVESQNPNSTTVDLLLKTIYDLQLNPVKMSKAFEKLATLYLNFGDGRVLLLENIFTKSPYGLTKGKITLSNIFEGTGPLMTSTEKGTGNQRHAKYRDSEVPYNGEWMDLETYKRDSGKIVSDIFAITGEIQDLDIKVGHPFVLVSDAVYQFSNQEDLIGYYIAQEKGEQQHKKVKLVYVSPPTVSVTQYLENLNRVYKRNETADTTMGSDFASFNILKLIMQNKLLENSELLAKPFFTVPGKGYTKLRDKVIKIAEKQESMSSQDFNIFLDSTEGLQEFAKDLLGKNTTFKSWKSFLQAQLRWYMMCNYIGSEILDLQNPLVIKRIQALEKLLKKYNINGIFYNPQFATKDKNDHIRGFKKIVNTNNAYTINGKIDTKAFKGNVLPLVDAILQAMNSNQVDRDFATYSRDNYKIFTSKQDKKKGNQSNNSNDDIDYDRLVNTILQSLIFNDNSLKATIKHNILEEVKKISTITSQEEVTRKILDSFKDIILIALSDNETLVLEAKTKDNKIITQDNGIYTIDGKQYKIENVRQGIDSKWEVEFQPLNPEQQKQDVNFDNVPLEDFKKTVNALISYYGDGDDKIKDIEVNTTNELIAKIMQYPDIISELQTTIGVYNSLKEDGDQDAIELFKKVDNIIQKINDLFTNPSQEDNNNMCNLIIS